MPLPAELRRGLDSPVADFANVQRRPAGRHARRRARSCAEFVPDGLPWAHIDIAGPAYNTGAPWGYTPKGGTGVPVRTLLATIEALIAERLTSAGAGMRRRPASSVSAVRPGSPCRSLRASSRACAAGSR